MKLLLKNASQLATFVGNSPKKGAEMKQLHTLENACVLITDGKIRAVFPLCEVDKYDLQNAKVIDCQGKTVLPGFVDCHTHFVFGGFREEEFNDRLDGTSYMQIMQKGGGIVNTVTATRQIDEQQLFEVGKHRLDEYLAMGVTTLEGKSGYGLDIETELKQLRVMQRLDLAHPMEVVPTYMGAHATPKEMTTEEYVDFIVDKALPTVAASGLALFCDVFCEQGVFDVEQSVKILRKAKELGLKLKVHADEIVPLGGSGEGAKLGATSVEHLLTIRDCDIKTLAQCDTIGVLLPATAFSLRESYAPARKMIDAGCAVAVATDLNPGSCYTSSIPLLIALSTMYMKMSVAEMLCALTLNAACAVCRGDRIGTIETGKQADLVIHDIPNVKFLNYNFAMNHVETVIKNGEIVYAKK